MAQGDFTRGLGIGSNLVGEAADLAARRQQFEQQYALQQAIEQRTAANEVQRLGLEGQRVGFEGDQLSLAKQQFARQVMGDERAQAAAAATVRGLTNAGPSSIQGVNLNLPSPPASTLPTSAGLGQPATENGLQFQSSKEPSFPQPTPMDTSTPITPATVPDNRTFLQKTDPATMETIAKGGPQALENYLNMGKFAAQTGGGNLTHVTDEKGNVVPGLMRNPATGEIQKTEEPIKIVTNPLTGLPQLTASYTNMQDAMDAYKKMTGNDLGTANSGGGVMDLVNKRALTLPVDQANQLGLPAKVPITPFGVTPQDALKAKAADDKNDEGIIAGANAEAQKASSQIGNINKFLQLSASSGGPLFGRNPLSSDVQQMENIKNSEVFSHIPKGIGRLTDREVLGLSKAFMLPTNNLAANKSIAEQKIAAANTVIDEAKFFTDYKNNFGTLRGADSQWEDYMSHNPIVDQNGNVVTKRLSYPDYFRAKNGQGDATASPAAKPQISEGTRVRQNGIEYVYKSGQYVPAQ